MSSLTQSQEYALEGAVVTAYREGWDGDLRKQSKRPAIWTYRQRIRSGTLVKLKDLGLVVDGTYPPYLTKAGVEAGVASFMRTVEGNVHPADFVMEERKREREDQREWDEQVARVKHLFRGLKLPNSGIYSRSHAMSRHVEETFGRQHGVMGGSLSLDLEDLQLLGEQIERLR
jgi:hypothetical protein